MSFSKKRETSETSIQVSLDLEGSGICEIHTGVGLLDFMLRTLGMAAGFDLSVEAKGDLETGDHHTVEDVGITLGEVLFQALKEGSGSAIVPSGESLATVALRAGEAFYVGSLTFQGREMDGMAMENFDHFLRALAYNGRLTLHLRAEGGDDMRKVEALMVALGRALRRAVAEEKN